MIATLRIENFALIDSACIDFTSGFTVITGETGSGKSILLNALHLILGERANFSVIGGRSDKSVVEAEIHIKDFDLMSFFSEHELDYEDLTIVRREINKQGRSRAFINDVPVQLSILKAFTSQLIHIHSQYNTLELKDVNFQLEVLDVLAEVSKERAAFKTDLSSYLERKKMLAAKREQHALLISQADYNRFQLQELESLRLDAINYETLEREAKMGENSEEIRMVLNGLKTVIDGEQGSIDQLMHAKSLLAKRLQLSEAFAPFLERIQSVIVELEDLSREAEKELESIDVDPRKMDEMIAMLDAYHRVSQKHGVQEQAALIHLMNELVVSTEGLDRLESEITALEHTLAKEKASLDDKADALHALRLASVEEVQESIKKVLRDLKLENTELVFRLKKDEHLNEFGNSKLEIVFSPNIGIEPVPIHQAASGGELSRVMLALQSRMSSKIQLRTVLFDEIDTGVSGDVAQKMGETLKKMGDGMQVIAITHLPQVAAKGLQHLKVEKKVIDGKTNTFVFELNAQQRIEEIARLMSGDQINEAAKQNAIALMES